MLKSKILNDIGTTLTTVQTVPSSNVNIVLMVSIKNKLTTNTAVDVTAVKSTGEIFSVIPVSPVVLPGEVVTWEGKMFLEAGDMIKVVSDQAASIDIMTNYVEKVNA